MHHPVAQSGRRAKQENHTWREDLQRLRDEINRLKGEQGQPTIKPATKPDITTPTDHAAERERHKPHAWAKGHTLAQIVMDREQVRTVDRAMLPPEAACKG